MAKTDLTIDITGKLKKSYSLKGKTDIIIIGDLETSIIDMKASGSTLTVNLEGGKTLKFTNISDPHQINITADGDVQTLEKFYDHPVDIDWTPKKGNKVTATVFDDFIDLSETTYAPTSKKAIKNNTGLNINGGKGDDYITGSKYNDTITGGLGENRIFYDENEQDEFGSDTIKFTKGENLIIDLTSMDLDEDDFRELLTHDSKNLFISLSDEEKVKLNSFYKSNGVGANGSVKVLLQVADPDEGIEEISVDLNEDILLSFTAEDANKKGAITGSRLGDSITGGEGVKSINGGAGNDYIVGGEGNQTLKGGAGADIFEFAKDDGVDVITDAKKEDKIIINDVENMSDLAFKKVGNNLEIFYGEDEVEPTEENPFGLDDDNKIVIKNYFKTKEADRIDTVVVDDMEYSLSDWYYITQGSGKIKGTEGRDILWGSAKADTIYGYDGDDDIYAAGGNDKLTGGKGDDNLYGGSGKNTFFFTAGDGDDYVWDADKDDVIQIDSDVAVACEKNGDNLIIKYANDSITLYDYYTTSEGNRVDTLKVKNGKKYNTISIKDILPVDGKILMVDDGDVITLSADSEYETLKFVSISNPQYVNCSRNFVDGVPGDNLIVEVGTAKITLTDYMKGGHSVKFFQTGPYDTSYDIPYHIGTDGDDTFDAQIIQDYFFTKGGNDTIKFYGKDFTIVNDIITEGTSDNTTTLKFDNYAFEDDNLRLEYFENMYGYNRLDIYASKELDDGNHFGQVGYEYYFDANKPTAVIKDSKGAIYNLNKYATATTLNWLADSDNGHVAFLLGTSGTDSVTSNNKVNLVFSEKDASLSYTYGGGKDKVYQESYTTNDTYNISSLTKNTHLVIKDNGGSDAINLNNTAGDDIRLFFDVSVTSSWNEETESYEYHTYAYPSSALVYSGEDGVFNSTTLTNYLANPVKWTDGVIATDFSKYNSETRTYEEMATITTLDGQIDLNEYKTAVAERVCEWFAQHRAEFTYSDLPSISGAIEHGQLSGDLLDELLALYDFKYSDIGGGVIEPDSDGFFNLSDGDGASIIKTYTSANKIRFVDAEVEDLTYTKDGNNLVIKYSDGESDAEEDDDTVTIENFFTNTSRIDDVYFGEEELPTLSIKTNAIIGVELDRDAGFIKSDSGCTGYIVKVLANGTNSLTGLTSDDFVDLTDEEDTSSYELNSAGMNVTCGADKVIITDFDPQTPPVIRVAGEEDDLSEKELVVSGLSNFDGSTYGFGEYSINGTTSADTLKGGAGDDTFVAYQGNDTITGGVGADSFKFWTGHGVDTIVDAEDDDVIVIDYKSDTTGGSRTKTAADVTAVLNDDNKVEIRYSDNDKVIIDNYDIEDPENNIDTIRVITADGTTTELSIADLLDNGGKPDADGVYNFRDGDGAFVITDYTSANQIRFVDSEVEDLTYTKDGNDLVIVYNENTSATTADKVTIQNFFTSTSRIDDIYIGEDVSPTLSIKSTAFIGVELAKNSRFVKSDSGCTGYIVKVLANGTNSLTGLTSDDFVDFEDEDTSYYQLNSAGMNVMCGADKVIITDFDPQTPPVIRIAGEEDDFSTKDLVVSGLSNFDGTSYGFGSYSITGTTGADTLKGGAGEDVFVTYQGADTVTGGAGADSFRFWTGHGVDTIVDAEYDDTIIIDYMSDASGASDDKTAADVTAVMTGDNKVEIRYSDNDKVIIDNYDPEDPGSNIDTINVITADGITTELSIADLLSDDGGDDPIEPTDPTVIDGTDGDDEYVSTEENETFNLKKGSDTVTFGVDFGNDVINTEADIDAETGKVTNKDTLVFEDRSVLDNDITFNYESGGSDLTISVDGGTVTYNDFFADDMPNLEITDGERTYQVDRVQLSGVGTGASYDWTDWFDPNQKDHILFIDGNNVDEDGNYKERNYIRSWSRDNYHIINTSGTHTSYKDDSYHYYNFIYDYSAGHDTIYSRSEVIDDEYLIQDLDKYTDVTIYDAGGKDRLYLGADVADTRVIFDVSLYETGNVSVGNQTLFVSSHVKENEDDYEDGNFSTETVTNFLSGEKVNGVLVNATVADDGTFGIEKVRTQDTDNPWNTFDVDYWKERIAYNVAEWLEVFGVEDEYGVKTVYNTLQNADLDEEALDALKECYNIDYLHIPAKPEIDGEGYRVINDVMEDEYTPYNNEDLKGTVYNDKINGNGGADVIKGGKGDDIINLDGSTGSTVNYIFAYNDKLQSHGNDKVLNSTSVDSLRIETGSTDMTMRFYKVGSDLTVRFFEGDYESDVELDIETAKGSIMLKGYYDQEETDRISTVNIVTTDGTTNTTISDLITQSGGIVVSTDTIFLTDAFDISFSVEGNDLILSYWDSMGDQTSETLEGYFSGECTYKYIQIDDGEPVSINEFANIQIGTDDADTLNGTQTQFDEEYFENNNDIFFGKGGNDEISPNGSHNMPGDYVNAGEGNNNIYLGNSEWEMVTVANGGGTDTLVFREGTNIEVEETAEGDPDLRIRYTLEDMVADVHSHGSVTIPDFKNGSSVKYIKIGDVTYSIDEFTPKTWYGTDGDDRQYTLSSDATVTTTMSKRSNDTFYFGKGNDTLTLNGEFGIDNIYSEAELDSDGFTTNTDTLVFGDRLASEFNLYKDDEYDYIDEGDAILIGSDLVMDASVYDEETGKESTTRVTYKNFFMDDETPNLIIKDKNTTTYYVEKYNNDNTLSVDWSDNANNHYAFIQTEEDSATAVISNEGINHINKAGNGNMEYTYGGGIDNITSYSYEDSANDTYNVGTFTANTEICIGDNGGDDDTINVNVNSDNLRMIYDVKSYNDQNSFSGVHLVHVDNFSAENVRDLILTGEGVNALSIFSTYYDSDSYSYKCGIETFNTTDHTKTESTESVDMNAWFNEVVSNVQGWLTNHSDYTSAYTAFRDCDDAEALAELYQCYNIKYNDIAQG